MHAIIYRTSEVSIYVFAFCQNHKEWKEKTRKTRGWVIRHAERGENKREAWNKVRQAEKRHLTVNRAEFIRAVKPGQKKEGRLRNTFVTFSLSLSSSLGKHCTHWQPRILLTFRQKSDATTQVHFNTKHECHVAICVTTLFWARHHYWRLNIKGSHRGRAGSLLADSCLSVIQDRSQPPLSLSSYLAVVRCVYFFHKLRTL